MEAPFKEAVQFLNAFKGDVISLDVPSGLRAEDGEVRGPCVRAKWTLTFGAPKVGLLIGDGPQYCGRIKVLSIGIPQSEVENLFPAHIIINRRFAQANLLPISARANKFSRGRISVVAGSPGKWGAAALCCKGAYRMGAGYVTLVTDENSAQKYLGKDLGPEVLLTSYQKETKESKAQAFIIGPGSGMGSEVKQLVLGLKERNFDRVILDADALTLLSEIKRKDMKFRCPSSWILTPHAGELERLLEISSREIERNRLQSVRRAAQEYGCHVLLKGFRTLVAKLDGDVGIVVSGNAALAKAGTGDVLSGMIGALFAQQINSFEIACTAAFIHGRVADNWVKSGRDQRSFMASDILENLPQTIASIRHVK